MGKLAFRTAYSGQVKKHVPTGNGKYWEYEEQITESGEKVIVKTKEINRLEEIQSYKDDCLIENIMKRAEMGDYSGLRKEVNFYDTTQMPKSMIEAYMLTHSLEQEFNKLPLDERLKYNNNFGEYLANAGMLQTQNQLEGEKDKKANETTEPPKENNNNTGEGGNTNEQK